MIKRIVRLFSAFLIVCTLFSIDSVVGSSAKEQAKEQTKEQAKEQTKEQAKEQTKAQTITPKSFTVNFGKDPTSSLNLTWHTSTDYKQGCVQYIEKIGYKSFDNSDIANVIAKSYETSTNSDKRIIHKAALIGLKPGTEYIYRIGDCLGRYGMQGVFKTEEQNLMEFTFLNITDTQGANSGDYSKWEKTLNYAIANFPEAKFLLNTGDMVDNGHDIKHWDLFAKAIDNRLFTLPIVLVVGNHDASNYNLTNIKAKNFRERFNLPKEKETGAAEGTVYSLDYGQAHISVMNTQCGTFNLKKQAEWLKRDMKRSSKPWRIVALHRGPYGAKYNTTDIRRAWAAVFDELAINLVLAGHDHTYVRSYQMKGNRRVSAKETAVEDFDNKSIKTDITNVEAPSKGTVYLTANSGGVKFYPVKKRDWQQVALQPDCQTYVAVTVAFNKLEVGAYDVKGRKLDGFSLEKN